MTNTTDHLLEVLTTLRQTGQTTTCIGVLLQNKNAVLVVGSYRMKQDILRNHTILTQDRVITVQELGRLSGRNPVLIFDTTAVIDILGRGLLDMMD